MAGNGGNIFSNGGDLEISNSGMSPFPLREPASRRFLPGAPTLLSPQTALLILRSRKHSVIHAHTPRSRTPFTYTHAHLQSAIPSRLDWRYHATVCRGVSHPSQYSPVHTCKASARNGKVTIVLRLRWLHKFHRVNWLLGLALHV